MLVAITVALAALAVLAAIVIVAVGGGGELSTEHPDHPPLALPGRRPVGGTDVALLRLPLGLWGYHKQITDEALERFAYELTERDTRIAVLEQELAEARQGGHGGTRDRRPALPPARDMPIMGEDPLATRTDRPPDLQVPGGDPLATRTDQDYHEAPVTRGEPLTRRPTGTANTDGAAGYAERASGPAYAPPADPWKKLADHSDDEADDKMDDEAEDKPGDEAGHEADDRADDAEDRRPARKDDGE